MYGLMFALLMLSMTSLYVAVVTGDRDAVEVASIAVVATSLLALLVRLTTILAST